MWESSETFLSTPLASRFKEPTEWSKSYNKSPVTLRPGTALRNDKSFETALCNCLKSPLAGGNNESIQLAPTVPVGRAISLTIRPSTFGPAFAGATKRSCPWNLVSHFVVPPSDISALVPCFAYNQSPKESTPSLSCFATIDNSLSYDTTRNAEEYTPCGWCNESSITLVVSALA